MGYLRALRPRCPRWTEGLGATMSLIPFHLDRSFAGAQRQPTSGSPCPDKSCRAPPKLGSGPSSPSFTTAHARMRSFSQALLPAPAPLTLPAPCPSLWQWPLPATIPRTTFREDYCSGMPQMPLCLSSVEVTPCGGAPSALQASGKEPFTSPAAAPAMVMENGHVLERAAEFVPGMAPPPLIYSALYF